MGTSPDFAQRVHRTVGLLQAASRDESCRGNGDAVPAWFKIWRAVCDVSMDAHARVFARLGVDVTPRPESLYTADAPGLVEVCNFTGPSPPRRFEPLRRCCSVC